MRGLDGRETVRCGQDLGFARLGRCGVGHAFLGHVDPDDQHVIDEIDLHMGYSRLGGGLPTRHHWPVGVWLTAIKDCGRTVSRWHVHKIMHRRLRVVGIRLISLVVKTRMANYSAR
jgi:hypothetical protein